VLARVTVAAVYVSCDRIVTCAPGALPRRRDFDLGILEGAAMRIENGRVSWIGSREEAPDESVYLQGTIVPGLVDAHTHPVYAGSRLHEFALRAKGATYQEIHAAGGGIHSTVRATRAASYEELLARTERVLARMLRHGTTTLEAKSGYGLDEATEIRDLQLLGDVASPMRIVRTYLGAHAMPPDFADRREEFVKTLIEQTLPRIARERLADACDVFCEDGAFTLDESRRILAAARAHGLDVKAHAEEFAYLGGARMAASLGARSVDHLLSLPEHDFAALAESGTVAVLLPGTTLFLGKERYAPARGLIDAGVPVAIATDFNAGSCMTESLPMAMSLAVLKMKMTPEEALIGATVNASHALGVSDVCGSLEVGKAADFLVLEVDDPREWLYHFGVNLVREVWIAGRRVSDDIPC